MKYLSRTLKLYPNLLFLILVFAFFIRLVGLDHGLPYLYISPESMIVNPVVNILFKADLKPHNFSWPGSFIIYPLAILIGIILVFYYIYCFFNGYAHNLPEFKIWIKNNPLFYYDNNPILVYFLGRLLTAVFGVITIYIVYIIAKRLFSKHVGLLAAFCLSIAPAHVTWSRILRPDVATTMLVMFSLYFLLRSLDGEKNLKWLILSSLFAGFSISAKYTSGVIIFPIVIHCLVNDAKEVKLLTSRYLIDFLKIKTNLSRAILLIFIGFFIFAPFAVLDFRKAIRDIMYVSDFSKCRDACRVILPGLPNYIWYLKNPLRGAIGGLFFEIFAGLGLCLILYKNSYKRFLFSVFPILFLLVFGLFNRYSVHWIMPLYPFEAILFGIGFYASYEFFIQKKAFHNHKSKVFLLFTIALIWASVTPVIKDIKEAIKLTKPNSGTIAKEWMESYLPKGSKIAYEVFTAPLDVKPRGDFNLIYVGFNGIISKPLSYYRSNSVDYVIISGTLRKLLYCKAKIDKKYRRIFLRNGEFKNEIPLIKSFNKNRENSGPHIEIYKLK